MPTLTAEELAEKQRLADEKREKVRIAGVYLFTCSLTVYVQEFTEFYL